MHGRSRSVASNNIGYLPRVGPLRWRPRSWKLWRPRTLDPHTARRVASPTFVPLHVSGRLGRPPNMHEPRAQEKDASERQWLSVT